MDIWEETERYACWCCDRDVERWDTGLEYPEPLKMTALQKVQVLVWAFLGYGALASAYSAGTTYVTSGTGWWQWWTLFFCFLPGLFHSYAQFKTYYNQPGEGVPAQLLGVGAKPARFRRRKFGFFSYLFVTLLNLFQFRLAYEGLLSFWWGFQTGPLLDVKVTEVLFRDVPQILLQAYIFFTQWSSNVNFDFTATIICTVFAMLNIIAVPTSSPCFVDSRTLVEVHTGKEPIADAQTEEEQRKSMLKGSRGQRDRSRSQSNYSSDSGHEIEMGNIEESPSRPNVSRSRRE